MPKMQVYLPEALYVRVKHRGERLNVSSILQRALDEALAELERQDALDEVVRGYESEHAPFSDAELRAREASDRAASRRRRSRTTTAA